MARRARPNRRRRLDPRLRTREPQGTVMRIPSLRRCAYPAISAGKFRALSTAGGASFARAAFLCGSANRATTAQEFDNRAGDLVGGDLGNGGDHRGAAVRDEK